MNLIATLQILQCLSITAFASRKIIKSLGREANLGDLYNFVKDEFLHISAFSEDFPPGSTEIVTRESQVCKGKVIHGFSERNRFISLSTTNEIAAYAEIFTISGSTEIVKDFRLRQEAVNAMVVFKETRCLERIKLGRCKLVDIYNPFVGKENSATHIVTAIRWGAEVNFGLTFEVKETASKMKYEQDIDAQLQGYGAAVSSKATFDGSSSDWLKRSTFESTYHGDIRVKNPIPTNFTQIVEIIENFSAALNATRGGKGQRIYYILKTIDEVSRSFNCDNSIQVPSQNISSMLNKDEYFLEKVQRRILRLYYTYEEIAEKLLTLHQKANSNRDFLSSLFLTDIRDLILKYDDCRSDFNAVVRKCIIELREAQSNATNVTMGVLNAAIRLFRNQSLVQRNLTESKLNTLTHKISDRKSVGDNAEWANNGETVETFLRKYKTGRVFIFFVKEIWRDYNATILDDGFFTLINLGGRKVIIDCDLDVTDRKCLELDYPVIRFYHNGHLQDPDVIFIRAEVDQSKLSLADEVLSGFAG